MARTDDQTIIDLERKFWDAIVANDTETAISLMTEKSVVTGSQGLGVLGAHDYLILSTIHSAKGQEWKNVFVLNTVDGCIPSDLGAGERAELEEERRLLYVAMTRAKDGLSLVLPQRFYVHGQAARGDRHVYANRTRFITDAMLDRFAQLSWPPAGVGSPVRPAGAPQLDLKAKMRGMWK